MLNDCGISEAEEQAALLVNPNIFGPACTLRRNIADMEERLGNLRSCLKWAEKFEEMDSLLTQDAPRP